MNFIGEVSQKFFQCSESAINSSVRKSWMTEEQYDWAVDGHAATTTIGRFFLETFNYEDRDGVDNNRDL